MPSATRRHRAPVGLVVTAASLALFVYTVYRTGPRAIAAGVGQLGPWFMGVLILSGLRDVARAAAWRMAIEGDRRLGLGDAWAGRVSGEALGNLTAFGLLVSEPAKAAFVRHRIPIAAGLAGAVTENLIYILSVVLVVSASIIVLLAGSPVPVAVHAVGLASLVGFVLVGLVLLWLMTTRPLIVTRSVTWLHARGLVPQRAADWLDGLRVEEGRIVGFAARHRRRTVRIVGLHGLFHLLAVAEVYLVLALISPVPPTPVSALVLEGTSRLVTVVFRFVPLRLGVDEAASGLMAAVLQFGSPTGVTLAVVRKVRTLCWAGVGVALMALRPVPSLDSRV